MSKRFPKTLITGCAGMVGSYVDFGVKTDKTTLDVTDLNAVLTKVRAEKPKVIVHLAALTDLDTGEKDPSLSYMINTVGTYHVALAAQEVKAKVVYVSSLGVFDGKKKGPYTEKDLPNPQNYYGHSKYAGELILQGMLSDYIIARAGWMFGGGPKYDKKFVAKIIAQLKDPKTKEIRALSDVKGSPTFGKDLVAALRTLIAKDARGIYHLTNEGVCTRFDVAKHTAATFGAIIPTLPVNGDYFKLPAHRVRNESARSKINLMRPWREALTEYLQAEWGSK